MSEPILSVREIEYRDIESIAEYWLNASPEFLAGMGVDLDKMPGKDHWISMLSQQIEQSYPEKKGYCIIWEIDGQAVGHCNVNPIAFGEKANMHLHLWTAKVRQKGTGTALIRMTLPYFFNKLQLQNLYCEPYALNPAPNKALEKAGFEFVKQHRTIPGSLSSEQWANLWVMPLEKFQAIMSGTFP